MPPQNNAQVPPQPASTPTPAPAPATQSGGNVMAVLVYLGILIIIPFLTDAKNDPFVKFHLKQGLVLIIVEVIAMFINVIPFLGWIVGFILWIYSVVMVIIGIINVLSGKQKPLPIIGKFGEKFSF